MTHRIHRLAATWFAALMLLCGGSAMAQMSAGGADATAPSDATAVAAPPQIPTSLMTPRATMTTFIDAMDAVRDGNRDAMTEALTTLDLDAVSPLVRNEKGAELAWLLIEVIRIEGEPTPGRLPRRTAGDPYTWRSWDEGSIVLSFEEAKGWRFSQQTLEQLPTMLDARLAIQSSNGEAPDLSELPLHLRLRAAVPGDLRERAFVLEQWQWLGILVVILAGIVADKLFAMLLAGGMNFWRQRYAEGAFRELDDNMLRPLGLMALALIWWTGLNLLSLPAGALLILLVSVKFLACLSAVWSAYRMVDVVAAYLKDRALGTDTRLDDVLLPLATKTIKVFVTVMGIIFIADNLDIDVTSLVAGLGLGGLAFALAAKDVAGNLFGSVTVLLDRTFNVGDWIIVGDVEGTVERIGFRSTRVRTFYNSLVSVPNSEFITANVDNMGARQYRRLSCKFGIAYDTPPERIEAFCEGLREIVRLHPHTRKDSYHIYLNGLGSSSLEILIYIFWAAPDWATELRERHRFLIDALRLAEQLGVEYAFPTQTLFMRQGEDTPLPTHLDATFEPASSTDQACASGRDKAREIVAATLESARPRGSAEAHGSAGEDGG